MPELAEGTLIDGRYRVMSRLGAGGMADVFCAEDEQLKRKVALKLLHRRFAEDPGFVERFRREAQAAAGLSHPNVVSVYDRGAYDGTYYIAMEYLPGRSLKQLIREEAPLDPLRAIDLTLQILKAARFAHRRGVIHRDLKPHNVIVDDGGHAKVTDFGIARAGASDMTETGSIMGTAQYLSPEQAQGHAVSASSDLYSIGIVLYEMLTGRLPFDGESAVTIALKHVSAPPPPPAQFNPAIPPELEHVVMWTLNKNPADRPADADQLTAALEHVRQQIVSGEAGQRTASWGAVPAETPMVVEVLPDPVEEEPRGSRWPWLVLLLVLLLAAAGAAAYLLTRPSQKPVPTVVRDSLSLATTTLQNDGFKVAVIDVTDAAPPDTVISQDPSGGDKVNAGSTVTLKVSQGPGTTSIPTVVGLAKTKAVRAIRRAGLKVGSVQSESSSTVAAGEATRTDPPSGTSEPKGTQVTLFVSSGKPTSPVPNVVGKSRADAMAALHNAHFQVTVQTQTSTSVKPGTVISQNPSAGTSEAQGSTVVITVAQAPPKVKVPSVKGDTVQAATSALKNAGFTVTQQTQTVTQKSQNGIVIKQDPAAGTQLQKGKTVTITVGKYQAPTTTTTTTPTTTSSSTTTSHT